MHYTLGRTISIFCIHAENKLYKSFKLLLTIGSVQSIMKSLLCPGIRSKVESLYPEFFVVELIGKGLGTIQGIFMS